MRGDLPAGEGSDTVWARGRVGVLPPTRMISDSEREAPGHPAVAPGVPSTSRAGNGAGTTVSTTRRNTKARRSAKARLTSGGEANH